MARVRVPSTPVYAVPLSCRGQGIPSQRVTPGSEGDTLLPRTLLHACSVLTEPGVTGMSTSKDRPSPSPLPQYDHIFMCLTNFLPV